MRIRTSMIEAYVHPSYDVSLWSAMNLEDVLQSSTHYETLGVSRHATIAEIRGFYKKCALRFHPDKHADPRAHQAFICISEAFSVLKDSQERAAYDATLREYEAVPGPHPLASQPFRPPFQPPVQPSTFNAEAPPTASNRPQFGRRSNDRKYLRDLIVLVLTESGQVSRAVVVVTVVHDG